MTIEDTLRDARHGLRRWRDRPLFALTAIATIALATGAATALFSMVDGVLLKPLPYPAPDRLVIVNRTYPDWANDPILSRSWDRVSLAFPEFFDIRSHARTLETLAVRTSSLALLPPGLAGAARELRVDVVSASYFPLFGVEPIAGRLFEPEDDLSDRAIVVIGEALWRTHFGSDPAIIGRTLPLADGSRTIAGIVPAASTLGFGRPDIWEPLSATPASRRVDNDRNLDAYARLRDGVTLADATSEMDALLRENFHYPSRTGARVTLLAERQIAPVRVALTVLLGGALLLLVMACANVAGFLMGDASGRVREMRVRAALGARRGRLVRQLLVESALLAVVGGVAGFLIAAWGVRALVALAPANVPRLALVALDGRALAFAIAATAASALLAGTLPALMLARGGAAAIASGSARVTPAHRRMQARLLVVQLALGVTLLAGAGLFVRTLQNLDRTDTGFTRARILSARISLPSPLYRTAAQWREYFARAEEAIARLPGVEAAAVSSGLPFATGRASTSIVLGEDAAGGRREVEAQRRFVSPGYFRVMEMPIVEGRGFSAGDPAEGDAFVVVSEEMARRFWNGGAIGRRFFQGRTAFLVVGVTRDVRDQTLAAEPMSTFYVSTAQRPPWPTMRIVARTAVPPLTVADSARRALRAIDPAVPIEDVTTMEDLVFSSLADQRYRAVLLAALAVVAALLAAIGLYGAIARGVAERRREIGVRLALGARPDQVTRLFLGEAAKLAAAGGVLGLLGAVAAARLTASLLFGVGTLDAWTLVLVAASAAAIALGGGYLPARRASRLDPVAALRED